MKCKATIAYPGPTRSRGPIHGQIFHCFLRGPHMMHLSVGGYRWPTRKARLLRRIRLINNTGLNVHRVRRGDTLEAIAQRYDMSEDELFEFNLWAWRTISERSYEVLRRRGPKLLYTGETIFVPPFVRALRRIGRSIPDRT